MKWKDGLRDDSIATCVCLIHRRQLKHCLCWGISLAASLGLQACILSSERTALSRRTHLKIRLGNTRDFGDSHQRITKSNGLRAACGFSR